MSGKETFQFQTETKELLELMVHSVYSHKEIFLRELISNASDALDKLRLEALTREELRDLATDLHIRLERDTEARTLTVQDNGIGMTRDEIVSFIGTIAKSGTRDFSKLLKESKEKSGASAELIGQFGVGFYSSFMVADRVRLTTRKAGEAQTWVWESTGDGKFTIEAGNRESHGTSVTLFLKKESEDEGVQDFVDEWAISDLVKKYSDFVGYPIRMKTERKEMERDENGKAKEGGAEKVIVEEKTLNSMKAIWTKAEKDVTEDEYKEFYKHISHDWNEPLKWIPYRAEGATNDFRSLIYIPSKAQPDVFMDEKARGIHLYIKRVFIMNDCKDLIPEYMRFIKGVVDSEDLSLNISREILQQNRQIQNIRGALTRKVLDTLKGLRLNEKEKFLSFWGEFGKLLKEGLFKEPGDRERLFDVCLFQSTHSASELTTLGEYVDRMKPDQEAIYFLSGESRKAIENSPHLEAFKEKDYEVLLLTDPVDEIWVQFVWDFKSKRFQSAGKGKVELGSEEERKKAEESKKEKETTCKSLLEFFQQKLADHVKEVRLSSRLTSSPVCLVTDSSDMSPNLEALLKASGKDVPAVKRILELNPTHPLLDKLQKMYQDNKENPKLADYAQLLYGQAVLAEGGKLPDPGTFNQKLSELLVMAL
jgi:molecular chaperone HtpG